MMNTAFFLIIGLSFVSNNFPEFWHYITYHCQTVFSGSPLTWNGTECKIHWYADEVLEISKTSSIPQRSPIMHKEVLMDPLKSTICFCTNLRLLGYLLGSHVMQMIFKRSTRRPFIVIYIYVDVPVNMILFTKFRVHFQ